MTKTATVPGDTADIAGEVINYTIAVSNTGNTALTGITVSDPSVSDLAAVLSGGFNVGDTNLDNQLSTGETWQYTASHTVTQFDLDTNGDGDGIIKNTVTADSNETSPGCRDRDRVGGAAGKRCADQDCGRRLGRRRRRRHHLHHHGAE